MKKRLWYGTIKTEKKFSPKKGWTERKSLYLFHRKGLKFILSRTKIEIPDPKITEYISISQMKKEMDYQKRTNISIGDFFDRIPPLSNEAFDQFQQSIYTTRH